MSNYDFDLFVIGAGSGGVRGGRIAAGLGARVAVVESRYMGGTCVNVGCVPKKLFSYAAHFHEDFQDAKGFGWSIEGNTAFNWQVLRDNKTAEISRLNGIYQRLLDNAGAEVIRGHGSFVDEHHVKVDDQVYSAENIMIATGGWPVIPDVPGKELAISSNEIFFLENFPKRMVIVGGGYIALEFASIFNGLGAETHLIYRGPMFLRGFDDDVRQFVYQEMLKKGVNIHLETNISEIAKSDDGKSVTLTNGTTLKADEILYATGRAPLTTGIGLENTGVKLNERGAVVVDENYQTSVSNIYAVGDVIDRVALTPVALAEGMCVAHNLFGKGGTIPDYQTIPTAVFCHPNVGTVGLSEQDAVAKGYDITVFESDFKHLKNTLSGNEERIYMKMIVDKVTDRVLGCHMVGPDAGEVIQGIGVAMQAGATKAHFDRTIGIHPTAAEELVTMRSPRS